MPLTPGATLFEYRITRTLGQGAFGTVCLAHDTLLDRPVAIKELTAAAQADPVAFQRFLQEARAAGSLNHPNIVTIYTLKPVGDTMYIVMEYLSGGSLRGLLSQRGRLPVDDAVRIAADVCDGLAAAHAKGIVHRDIKPENILLAADGQAKVGDFGIAHVPRSAGGAYVGGLTQTGFQPGTLIYMSPEQIRGEAVDGRSDVYQVGALLYEMVAGRHYIDVEALTWRAQETAGGNVLRMQARLYDLLEEVICQHEPQDVRRVRPDVPDWLRDALTALLARQAEARSAARVLVKELRDTRKDYYTSAEINPESQELVDLINKAYETASWLWIEYHVPADEFNSEEEITQRWVIPLTPVCCGYQNVIFTAWCRHARLEKMAREEYEKKEKKEGSRFVRSSRRRLHGGARSRLDRIEHYTIETPAAHREMPLVGRDAGGVPAARTTTRTLEPMIRLVLNSAEAHYNLGVAYEQQGRLDEAIHEFEGGVADQTRLCRSALQFWALSTCGRVIRRKVTREILAEFGHGYSSFPMSQDELGWGAGCSRNRSYCSPGSPVAAA